MFTDENPAFLAKTPTKEPMELALISNFHSGLGIFRFKAQCLNHLATDP